MTCDYCNNKSISMLQNGERRCTEHMKVKKEFLSINKCIEYLKANKDKLSKEQSESLYGIWHKLTFYKYNKRK